MPEYDYKVQNWLVIIGCIVNGYLFSKTGFKDLSSMFFGVIPAIVILVVCAILIDLYGVIFLMIKAKRLWLKNRRCSKCGRSMQYCNCKFDHITTNWDSSKVIIQVVSINANVAPMTEFEYFQQIGDE